MFFKDSDEDGRSDALRNVSYVPQPCGVAISGHCSVSGNLIRKSAGDRLLPDVVRCWLDDGKADLEAWLEVYL